MFQITITIDETVITSAARRALADTFAAPTWSSDRGPEGYEAVRAQVREYVRALDVRSEIAALAPTIMQAIISDTLDKALRKQIKETVKQMQQDGTLLDGFALKPVDGDATEHYRAED